MSFGVPLWDTIWSLALLVGLVTTVVFWRLKRAGNPWAYLSLCLALMGAFPAAAELSLPASWAGASPLMNSIGPQAGALSMLTGAVAWGASVVALMVRYNWRPARDVGGVAPAYLGGLLGFCTAALNLWRLLAG